ncbi:MAG: 50S ribosomal protein L24 [Candidatus Diapherotrites archaeon]
MVTRNPGKQRLAIYHADLRTQRKLMSASLAKELRSKYGKRTTTVRVGDTVKVTRGDYKGKTGNITQVDYARNKLFIQGIMRKKTDGKEAFIAFKPSNVLITGIETKDKKRFKRKGKEIPTAKEDAKQTKGEEKKE